jgi:hypothetical protein
VKYVGETGISFSIRHKNHLESYQNGTYLKWTYDSKLFMQGKKKNIWEGPYYAGVDEFVRRRDELTPKIIAFLSTMKIFVAPSRASDLVRKRVESAIVLKLYKQPYPVVDFIDPDQRNGGNPE